jgi:hypothetical protein
MAGRSPGRLNNRDCGLFIAFVAMSGRVGFVVSHSKRKERVLNRAQSFKVELRVKR